MKTITRRFAPMLLFLTLFTSVRTHAQSLIVNGDFESPGGPSRTLIFGGDPYITGWTVTGNWVSYYDRHNDATGAGTHSVQLGYFWTPGGIEQYFPTDESQLYEVAFYVASDPYNGTLPGRTHVSVGNFDQVFTAPPQSGLPTVGWQEYRFQFQALGTSSRLRFEPDYQLAGSGMPLLDSITVTPVPEPGTVALVFLAGGLALIRFKRSLFR